MWFGTVTRYKPATPAIRQRAAMVHGLAGGVRVLVGGGWDREHAHHEVPGHAKRIRRLMAFETAVVPLEPWSVHGPLFERIEDHPHLRIQCGDLELRCAAYPPDGDRVVEEERAGMSTADERALRAGVRGDERLRSTRNAE